jgi:hypothetical protein
MQKNNLVALNYQIRIITFFRQTNAKLRVFKSSLLLFFDGSKFSTMLLKGLSA